MIRTVITYILLGAMGVVMWIVLPGIYGGASLEPSTATGQVYELNNHGTIVYVTELEKRIQTVVTPVLSVVTFAAVALHLWLRKKRKRDTRGLR